MLMFRTCGVVPTLSLVYFTGNWTFASTFRNPHLNQNPLSTGEEKLKSYFVKMWEGRNINYKNSKTKFSEKIFRPKEIQLSGYFLARYITNKKNFLAFTGHSVFLG